MTKWFFTCLLLAACGGQGTQVTQQPQNTEIVTENRNEVAPKPPPTREQLEALRNRPTQINPTLPDSQTHQCVLEQIETKKVVEKSELAFSKGGIDVYLDQSGIGCTDPQVLVCKNTRLLVF